MLSDFTKSFGRNFIVSYFLPSVLFITMSILIFSIFLPQETADINKVLQDLANIWTFAIWIFVAWTFGVLLMALNRVLVRLLEGYHLLEHTPLQKGQEKKFVTLKQEIEEVEEKYVEEVERLGSVTKKTRDKHLDLKKKERQFPQHQIHVLATDFGNIIRAAEVYSHEVYGIDAIPVWTRILAVVPEYHMDLIARVRASMNFAVNLFFLSLLTILQYLGYAVATKLFPYWGIPIIALLITIFAYRLALSTTRQWGEYIKSVFDLYRNDLLQKIGLEMPEDWDEEHELWRQLNRTLLYWEKPNELPRKESSQPKSIENQNLSG